MLVLIEYNCGEDCFAWTAPFDNKDALADWWRAMATAPKNPSLLRKAVGGEVTHTNDRTWAMLAEDPRNCVLYLNGDHDSVLRNPTNSVLDVLWVFHRGNPRTDFETSIDRIPPSLELVDSFSECREMMNDKIKEFLENTPMEA